jgi:hypothetical protein
MKLGNRKKGKVWERRDGDTPLRLAREVSRSINPTDIQFLLCNVCMCRKGSLVRSVKSFSFSLLYHIFMLFNKRSHDKKSCLHNMSLDCCVVLYLET